MVEKTLESYNDVLDKVELKKAKEIAANMKARGFSNEDISAMVEVDIKIVDSWFPDNLVLA